jgi:hypothetical protein
MKKRLSVLMALCMLLCGVGAAIPASAQTPEVIIIIDDGLITPFSSDVLSSWSPSLSRTNYGASITLRNFHSGTVTVELHDRNGYIIGFSESFTNRISLAPTRSRSTPAGTYKIVIHIRISGHGTTTRESHWMNLS